MVEKIMINVTVNVLFIGMGGYKKGVFSFCPPHSRFIANLVRFFWRTSFYSPKCEHY